MAQQFDFPETETQLREIQDKLYQHSKEAHDAGQRPAFKGLIEIMSAEATIVTAIHNIKSNRGSETPGVDFKTMRKDYLQRSHSWVIKDIQAAFRNFEPQKIRRKYIDKPGKAEKRPLGIPTIRDRIVQECMRIVLEPIIEAQSFAHSYGFRPMRSAAMALERVNYLTHNTGYHWIVEGDISKCFDHIDHSILLRRLYHMGVKDRRVLQIIKAMLKAGVMDVCEVNDEGTPQGGLISPLLANVYLDIMDEWISQQWECKRTRYPYAQQQKRLFSLRKTSLIPGFLVRYADDFVIITDTRAHAESWKNRLQTFLQSKMKLTLSQEKTLITDIRRKYIKFLGYEFKNVPGKGRKGYIVRTIPDRDRLKRKVDKIAEDIKRIPRNYSREQMLDAINRINSQIRGVIQYYQCCTWVNVSMKRYSRRLQLIAKCRLKQYKGKWIPANQTQNLPRVHQQYRKKIPSIKYRDIYVGFTALTFCRWERTRSKNQAETPYSEEGRQLYFKRTKSKRSHARLDELYSERTAQIVLHGKWNKLNNFEFIMNRAYALNRDKLKCGVCGGWLISGTPYAHRINPNLPLNKVNRVNNLVSLHKKCFYAVNDHNYDLNEFDVKAQKKIIGYREKLVPSHTRNK
ncbi:group II intron reverse transcriptase/maturase [uncultured Bacteroides sp.]|uniref:group II intron reverse transcriptase/maturase n=1 Tax=uncultured Bacteroides sp. TaxID=162156 RepID=UPI002596ED1C|nr:group II intron reverse transcriptase/maturase [uncultured Bacteroides sp.]